jgi:DNA mismatch repair ATPase MutS
MAGKSTLLRAIGTNIVLAQAGAPVCAAALELPPIRLATSMRVQDSLAHGVSYFMAELRRLKAVVDLAAAADQASAVCYLLDEILHGTNSAERQIAARRVIRHLVALGAIGAVSTHDLSLADDPRLAATAVQAHFGERVSEQSADLGFDYTLRPGPAPTTNALRLMALAGLPTDD